MRTSRTVSAVVVCLVSLNLLGGCPEAREALENAPQANKVAANVIAMVRVVYDDTGSGVAAVPVSISAVKYYIRPEALPIDHSHLGPFNYTTDSDGKAQQVFGYNLGGPFGEWAMVTVTATFQGNTYTAKESFTIDESKPTHERQTLARTITITVPRAAAP